MRYSKDENNVVLATARSASRQASFSLVVLLFSLLFFSFFFLFLFSMPAFAATQVLNATDWTSSQTITSESNAYGYYDGSTATFASFSGSGQDATAAAITDFTGVGTYQNSSFTIRMSSDGSINDDHLRIEYYDGTSWYEVDNTIQPGTSLTTYGPYDMTQTTTSGELNATQIRFIWTKVKGGDGVDIYVDGVEISVGFDAADLTAPDVNLTSPGNNTWDLDGSVTFQYDVYDPSNIANCSLYINETFNVSNSTPVTNGGSNSFTISLDDGVYLWNVLCVDAASANNAGWGDINRTIKIDTTAPIVNLEAPDDGNYSTESDLTFFWNASDAQTTLASCQLFVNDSQKDSWTTPAEDTSYNSLQSFLNGYYEWWVNCTDANGFETKSEVRNFTINTTSPALAPDKGAYTLGESAMIDGANWNPSVNITLQYQLSNGTNITYNVSTDISGHFMDNFYINYSYPDGTYNLFAYQWDDLSENASTSWTVSNLSTTVYTTPSSVTQGNQITVLGDNYVPNEPVNVTITYSDGSTESFITSASGGGSIGANRNMAYDAPLGLTNLTSFVVQFPNVKANGTFTITQRVASLAVDNPSYGRDEPVTITGLDFTRLGIVTLWLYDNTTKANASGYPFNKTADSGGDFTELWNTNGFCNGIYAVEAWDQNNSFLNGTASFEIDELVKNSDTVSVVSGFKGVGPGRVAITPSNVNGNDGTYESQASNSKTTWYYEFNFTNSYNPGLTVDTVEFVVEHYNSGTFTNAQAYFWNDSLGDWQSIGCPDLGPGTSDHNDTCDISTGYPTPQSLNSLAVRIEMTKTSGGTSTWSVDYARLIVNTSYQPACTYLNGTPGGGLAENPPFVQTVLLEDDLTLDPNQLDLNAGTTKNIWCNVTVSDNDGFGTITGVNATLYSSTVFEDSADDPRNHYTNDTCAFITGSGTSANYSCIFPVQYFAVNSTWTCVAYTTDGTDVDSGSDTSTLNPLYAININTTAIDYGEVGLNAYSGDQVANVSNIGNTQINVTHYAYGVSAGDGLAFDCDTNNLPLSTERYALTPSVPFASKTTAASTLGAFGLLIDEQTSPGAPPSNSTYWQVFVDPATAPAGNCTGTIVFQADAP